VNPVLTSIALASPAGCSGFFNPFFVNLFAFPAGESLVGGARRARRPQADAGR
jgi:hypothetical protein